MEEREKDTARHRMARRKGDARRCEKDSGGAGGRSEIGSLVAVLVQARQRARFGVHPSSYTVKYARQSRSLNTLRHTCGNAA